MRALRWLGIVVVVLAGGYVAIAALLFAFQRRLIFPAPPPRPVQIPGAQVLAIPSRAGTAHALWRPGPEGAPVVAHFHGNAEQLDDLGALADRWNALGFGFFAVELPGYGESRDRGPSQAGAFDDAEAALAFLRERLHVPVARTVLEGRSLGTGVAVEMAARGHGARLALLSPYTRLADVARQAVPLFPVELLLRDRFDSLGRAAALHLPVLVLHGRRDPVIPFALGQRLAAAIPGARFVALDAEHDDVFAQPAAWEALAAFATGS